MAHHETRKSESMEKLRRIIETDDTVAGRVFDIAIQVLIVLSLISFSIETLPQLSSFQRQILRALEISTVAIFTIEYVLRIVVAERKLSFIFSFYGLIDLLAILPFYIARGVDLRSIRLLRLMRLARVFKFLRYSSALQHYKRAFVEIRGELILFLIAACFVIYLAAVGIYYCENSDQPDQFSSVFHCLWWAVATLTTVGYGDVYPITVGGKIFTFFILFIGLGIVAVPAGLLASALTKTSGGEGSDSM
ncbi:Potassium voltage-gated channel subfamily KQT; possible potassium channel, VIC family [Olavius algarvensis associated proteobacterium Delta 3]|nr:Potassium voltage-gated channel subfamily KQT; possible potassium channel, VIC family [Olavius algarvensis associated proteobacterium Delta 3]